MKPRSPDAASKVRQKRENPFRYGSRIVKKQLANGEIRYEEIPLTLQDVCYPQEDDQLAHTL